MLAGVVSTILILTRIKNGPVKGSQKLCCCDLDLIPDCFKQGFAELCDNHLNLAVHMTSTLVTSDGLSLFGPQ